MSLRVCVAGVTGWTGRAVAEAVGTAEDLELVAGISRSEPASFSTVEEALDAVPTDVLVDFTTAAAVKGTCSRRSSGASPSSSARTASRLRVGLPETRVVDQLPAPEVVRRLRREPEQEGCREREVAGGDDADPPLPCSFVDFRVFGSVQALGELARRPA